MHSGIRKDTDASVKRPALLIATLASFLTPFMVSSINIALPAIGREFAMGAVALSWVPTSYLLSAAVSLVPLGRLADIYGRKRIFPDHSVAVQLLRILIYLL